MRRVLSATSNHNAIDFIWTLHFERETGNFSPLRMRASGLLQCFAEDERTEFEVASRFNHLCATSGIFPQVSAHQTNFAAAERGRVGLVDLNYSVSSLSAAVLQAERRALP